MAGDAGHDQKVNSNPEISHNVHNLPEQAAATESEMPSKPTEEVKHDDKRDEHAADGEHTPANTETETADDAPAPTLPDFYTDPNAVLKDKDALWRFGKAPDYAKTRKYYEETKKRNHEAGSLPSLVENLVKNWEIEASFKTRLSDWRTINKEKYTFALNGGPSSKVDYMLKQGTYNALLTSNDYYCPEKNDFSLSHKTFKRMMPTFAWEVLEVYSGPPQVAFRWRHWGVMKSDYSAINRDGVKVSAKAHGGPIDIEGVTVAQLDDKMQIVHLDTWFDPMTMFNQIAPNGVTKSANTVESKTANLGTEDDSSKREYGTHPEDPKPDMSIAEDTKDKEYVTASGSHDGDKVYEHAKLTGAESSGHGESHGLGDAKACPFLQGH